MRDGSVADLGISAAKAAIRRAKVWASVEGWAIREGVGTGL